MFRDPRSTTLYLSLEGDIGTAFSAFMTSYETYVAEKFEYGELSTCLRNGSFRVTAWDDVQWFDEAGAFLKDPPASVDGVACVLEFGGCWVGAAKWGLKWRVQQIQARPRPRPAKRPGQGQEPSQQQQQQQYAFLDD